MRCGGAKSFVDNLGWNRGVVLSRAATLLWSIETQSCDSKICSHLDDRQSLSVAWGLSELFSEFTFICLCHQVAVCVLGTKIPNTSMQVIKIKIIKIKWKATHSTMGQWHTTANTTDRQRRPGAIPPPGCRGPRSWMIHPSSTFLLDTAVAELFTEEILLNNTTNRQRRPGAIAPPSFLLVDTVHWRNTAERHHQ